jgi:hypothetical protein
MSVREEIAPLGDDEDKLACAPCKLEKKCCVKPQTLVEERAR